MLIIFCAYYAQSVHFFFFFKNALKIEKNPGLPPPPPSRNSPPRPWRGGWCLKLKGRPPMWLPIFPRPVGA